MVRLERDPPPALAGRAELSAADMGRARVERAQDGREGATRVLTPPAPPDADVSEEQFLQLVLDLARALGWLAYHVRDSRRSAPGFPDLVLVRNGRILFLELKVGRGRLTAAQREWGRALVHAGAANDRVAYGVLRPCDWGLLVRTLEREG
jgi:hypothetical protein